MKKVLSSIILSALVLSFCGCDNNNTSSLNSNQAGNSSGNEIGKSNSSIPNGGVSGHGTNITEIHTNYSLFNTGVNNAKISYGQGVQFDSKNRPQGAVDAQNKYGDMGAKFIGDEDDKCIYLTFDEGYENGFTPKILDILKEKNVTATFYVTYDYCERNKTLVKRMIDEGHKVGNHTYSHPSLPDCSDSEINEEIAGLHDYVKKEFNYEMTSIRPPKGEFSQRTLGAAKELGYESVFWSFAYADWDVKNQPNVSAAYEKITSRTHNGAIYLLHAVSETNTNVLGDVIDYWIQQGLQVKSI